MPGKFTRQSFSLPTPMLNDLKREAEESGMTLSETLRHYIRFGRIRDNQGSPDLRREASADDNGSQ